jgi:hypothetical protein
LRLDPAALVRLRPHTGAGQIWAMLPFRVLVSRPLAAAPPADVTVAGSDLLETLDRGGSGLARRDAAWQWPLPSSAGRVLETVPAAEMVRLAAAASRTLRAAATEGVGGRVVGERIVRDALLDHVAIVVTTDEGERIDVPQRLVQAVARMGFLGRVTHSDEPTTGLQGYKSVTVRLAIGWIGIDCLYGSAWYRPISPLRLR